MSGFECDLGSKREGQIVGRNRATTVPVLRLTMPKTLEGGALRRYKPAHPACIGSGHWLRATGSRYCVGATRGRHS